MTAYRHSTTDKADYRAGNPAGAAGQDAGKGMDGKDTGKGAGAQNAVQGASTQDAAQNTGIQDAEQDAGIQNTGKDIDLQSGVQDTAAQDPTGRSGKPKKASSADIFKFVGLLVFIAVMVIVIVLIWPFIGEIFQEGGLERLTDDVRDAGWKGVLILEALQFLQVVVAFIPGEVVQMAAGIIYGPWVGALLIFIGCVISSAFIFVMVHFLGAPFVRDMVPAKYLNKIAEFEKSERFSVIVFVLYLIPGMPKDVFTYILPLSAMRFGAFVTITNVARLPGIIVSAYAADGLVEGRIWESVIIFLVLAAIALVALLTYNKIIDALHKVTRRK